jgi:hypothetical protein
MRNPQSLKKALILSPPNISYDVTLNFLGHYPNAKRSYKTPFD